MAKIFIFLSEEELRDNSTSIVLNWRRQWHPTPVLLPGEFHGQRRLAGYSTWGLKESDMTERITLTHPGEFNAITRVLFLKRILFFLFFPQNLFTWLCGVLVAAYKIFNLHRGM